MLGITHSPARAGIAEFALSAPLLFLSLPAGALVDRWSRKRLLITCDASRCLAYTSLVVALSFGVVHYLHVLAVVFVDGCGLVFFSVAERSALRYVVGDKQLPTALARNQSRTFGALLAGTPLGGLLYSVGRLAPFVFDAVSYAVLVLTLSRLRARLEPERTATPRRLVREVREGVAWFWRQPFVRTTSLLAAGSDLTANALFLVVIVLERERGASPALIGAVFAFLGLGGLLGSLVAPRLSERLPTRVVVRALPCLQTALLPLLFVPGRIAPGIVYGAMFLVTPTWGAVVASQRIRLTPDELVGRVQSVATLLALGAVPLGFLVVGFALQSFGTTPTLLALIGLMLVVAAVAFVSPAIRSAP